MFAIDWTHSAVQLVWLVCKRHPHLKAGFRRRPLAAAIDEVIRAH